MGFVDPQRVGIQGHSWGGYQISYMITKTNIFRAVEAGASVVDMFGGYGGIRWGTGMSRAFQYEKTQSRIGVPPWKNPLILHGELAALLDREHPDAVPDDGQRRRRRGAVAAGDRVLHGDAAAGQGSVHVRLQRRETRTAPAREPEALDRPLAEYFDYFFKDAPKPEWMEAGVPYLDKGRRDVSVFYKKSTDEK